MQIFRIPNLKHGGHHAVNYHCLARGTKMETSHARNTDEIPRGPYVRKKNALRLRPTMGAGGGLRCSPTGFSTQILPRPMRDLMGCFCLHPLLMPKSSRPNKDLLSIFVRAVCAACSRSSLASGASSALLLDLCGAPGAPPPPPGSCRGEVLQADCNSYGTVQTKLPKSGPWRGAPSQPQQLWDSTGTVVKHRAVATQPWTCSEKSAQHCAVGRSPKPAAAAMNLFRNAAKNAHT